MCERNDLEEHFFIFLKHVSNDQYIYIYPDMTCRENQYKFDSEHDWLMHCT